MANQYAAQVSAAQVGSYFVQQYYQVFQQQRDFVHQFYNDSSTMVRVDGKISHSASDLVKIHQMLMSLNFTDIELETINSLESWNRGVLVAVTGFIKSMDFNQWRAFVQTFFLAPQEKGYFVLNDMFHFADNDVAHQSSTQVPTHGHNVEYHPTISTHPDPPVSDYTVEEEAAEYVQSVHIDRDEPVDDFDYQEHLGQEAEHVLQFEPEPEPEFEPEPKLEPEIDRLDEGTPYEEHNTLASIVTIVQKPHLSVEEPIGEPGKLTYASILRAKGKSPPLVSSQPTFAPSPPVADWNHVSQPLQKHTTPNLPNYGLDVTEENLPSHEGEPKSVYVRNLPSTITSIDIEQEFENFGRIKYDGVFLRNRADTGVCYAFVEFEDIQSVRNALQASPIQLAGRKVYIEERRPNSGAARGGRSGGRGRGRGGRTYGK